MKKQQENAQIREVVEHWAKAVREKDIEEILAHHTQNFVMFDVPPPLQLKGLEEYRKSWEPFFAWEKDSGVFDISEMTIVASEEVAFCYASMRCAGYSESGKKEELRFRLTIGLEKIAGKWMIRHEHHSVPAE